jgi:hypothetical protein
MANSFLQCNSFQWPERWKFRMTGKQKIIGIPERPEMIGKPKWSPFILYLELQFATLGGGNQSGCRNNKNSRISFLSAIPIWSGAPEYWPSVKESAVFSATQSVDFADRKRKSGESETCKGPVDKQEDVGYTLLRPLPNFWHLFVLSSSSLVTISSWMPWWIVPERGFPEQSYSDD